MTDFAFESRHIGGVVDTRWRVSKHGEGNARPGTLDVSKFVKGTHYNIGGRTDGVIPSGVVLKYNDGMWEPWSGEGAFDGILNDDAGVAVTASGKAAAAILVHGIIDANYLPVEAQRAPVVTAESTGSFVFDK